MLVGVEHAPVSELVEENGEFVLVEQHVVDDAATLEKCDVLVGVDQRIHQCHVAHQVVLHCAAAPLESGQV